MLFNAQHLTVIFITLLVSFLIIFFRNKPFIKKLRWPIVALIIFHIVYYYTGHYFLKSFSFPHSLPFHLCSISLYLVLFGLVFNNEFLKHQAYFWGLVSAFLAILLPDLNASFPDFKFNEFFLSHFAIFIGCLYIGFVERILPNYKILLVSFASLGVYTLLASFLNKIWNANFLYLQSPAGLPKFFPDPPFHIPVLAIFAFIIFSLEFGLLYLANRKQ